MSDEETNKKNENTATIELKESKNLKRKIRRKHQKQNKTKWSNEETNKRKNTLTTEPKEPKNLKRKKKTIETK